MTIKKKNIRKIKNADNYKLTIEYIVETNKKIIHKSVSWIEKNVDRRKANHKLNFRLNGLTANSKVVHLAY